VGAVLIAANPVNRMVLKVGFLVGLTRISHGDLHKNGEIGGQSRMVRGANQNQPTISPCNRLLKANLNFKGIMAVV